MFKLANERSPATNKDIEEGREAKKALLNYFDNIDTKGFKLHFLDKKDDNQIFDFCSYNENLDICIPIAVEGKKRELFNKVLNGYKNIGNANFKDIQFSNKKYYNLMSKETRDSCIHIIKRQLTDKELDKAVIIMIPLDAPKKLDFGFKINIFNSIYKYYNFNILEELKNGKKMPHNSRRIVETIKRDSKPKSELDYILKVPFNEAKLNDYTY